MSNGNVTYRDRPRKGHVCEECGKDFSSTHQLAQHSRIHTGEKPYKCAFCDRSFKQLSHVQQHTRLHTGERPYKCPKLDCGKAFIQLSNLNQHLKVHANSRSDFTTNLVCTFCSKIFKSDSSLLSHKCKSRRGSLDPDSYSSGTSSSSPKRGKKKKKNNNSNQNNNTSNANSNSNHNHNNNNNNNLSHQNDIRLANEPLTSGRQLSSQQTLFEPGSGFWSCAVCKYVFPSELALVSHVQQMRSDGKHHVLFGSAVDPHHHLSSLANHSSMDLLKKNMI